MKYFSTQIEFVRWLSTPLATLKGRAPIEIMYARDGQSLVHGILVLMAAEKFPGKKQGGVRKLTLLPEFRRLMRKRSSGSLQEALDEVRQR